MSTPNMGLVLPTDHGSAEVWDTILDTIFGVLDAHSHTTGSGVPIASAALRINADVSWSFAGTSYAISDLKAVDFAPSAASSMTSFAGALFVNSADNELYYRTIAGVNVKFTSGAALNVTGFVGGIGGDYSAVGALESFDDATDRYLFQQQGAPRPWAGVAVGNIDLYQQAASIVNKVQLKSPNALAASYAWTFPPALPGAQTMLQLDTAGNVVTSNAVVGNIVLAGAGHVQRSTRTITVGVTPGNAINISGGGVTTTTGVAGVGFPTTSHNAVMLPITTADFALMTVVSVNVYCYVVGGNTDIALKIATANGTFSTVATVSTSSVTPKYTAQNIVCNFDCTTFLSLPIKGAHFYIDVNTVATTCAVLAVDFITTVPS